MRSEANPSEASAPLFCKGGAATLQVYPVGQGISLTGSINEQGTAKPQGLLWSSREPIKADSITFQGLKELEGQTLELRH